MKQEKEFLKESFSIGEYLGKVLADESGEYSRIRDGHIRILSRQNKALAKEIISSREKVEEAVKALVKMTEESKKVLEELPELFLPLLECKKKAAPFSGQQKEFKAAMERVEGGKQFVTKGRELLYRESIDFLLDGQNTPGAIYVSSDLILISVEKKTGEEEVHNALLLKECAVSVEDAYLLISLPPVVVEIVSGEHSSFSKLKAEIDKAQKAASRSSSSARALPAPHSSPGSNRSYNRYLLRIGFASSMQEPSEEELVEEVLCIYRTEHSWSRVGSSLEELKRRNIHRAFSIFAEASLRRVEEKVEGMLQERADLAQLVEKASIAIKKSMKKASSTFKEKELAGSVSIYFESIHLRCSELFIRHCMHFSKDEMDTCCSLLRKAFVYEGYIFSYTVGVAQEAEKEALKRRYAFGKRIVQYAFEEISHRTICPT